MPRGRPRKSDTPAPNAATGAPMPRPQRARPIHAPGHDAIDVRKAGLFGPEPGGSPRTVARKGT